MPEDEIITIDGLSVSASLLRSTHDMTREIHTMNTEHGVILKDLHSAARETATASTTMAALAKAREKRDAQQAQAKLEAQKARSEREHKTQERIASWFSENWRYLGLILLLVFYPQVITQLQTLGLLPAAKPLEPVMVPVPVPVPVSEPELMPPALMESTE